MFDEQFSGAYDLLENNPSPVFVTGKAGTGKSTLLQYFRGHTSKNIVVLAPTGVAAVNVRGQTIHSFFLFRPDITPEGVHSIRLRKAQKTLYKKLDAVVIDEISMVRSDLLDCVDAFLRRHGPDAGAPFGGVQMIFFGDLYQLPPVMTRFDRDIFKDVYASPYFFDAASFKQLNFQIIELQKIYRQKDEAFIRLLNNVRDRSVSVTDLEVLNRRLNPRFNPGDKDFYVYLTTTNALADQVNQDRLKELPGESSRLEGKISDGFDVRSLPTHQRLELKMGAQVMLLNNDPGGKWVNGTIGKVFSTAKDHETTGTVRVALSSGLVVDVPRFTWEVFRFFYNKDTEQIDAESAGSFCQYPLKLAWAITIHKSQGKTFSKVVLDIGGGTFAPGQMYVALSRCTDLEGLVLKKPIFKRHILLDDKVVRFMTEQSVKRGAL
ncbi:MAG: AAA family ATPase [Omnitrophica WOR_2 bacterium RIFCSPHIGHO2_01_FULL_52_10]|nr:MAG: AAA family ATPase [Omnitrophica WOR_2 bacterium RIFCSPHIGHO2_01_FULL_52_10]